MITRTRIRDVRRRDVQRAAYEVVVERGFGGATITGVAEKLGMSRGTVYQYFPEKEDLFEAAVRHTNAQISTHVAEKLRNAECPRKRLSAVIEGTFAEELFQPSTARFWLAFLSQTSVLASFDRLQRVLMARMRSNLLHELKKLTDNRSACELADEISMLIDGLWARRSLDPGSISSAGAVAIAERYIDLRLAGVGARPVSPTKS